MSKSSRSKKSVPSSTPETNLRLRADVRKIHEHGQELPRTLPRPVVGHRPKHTIEKRAKELGINPAELRKRLLFAETYDERELNRLLSLETPNGKTLSWGHIRKLLTIQKLKDRRQFERKAVNNGWSVHFLTCEIEGRLGTGNPGNRRPTKPRSGVGTVGRPPNSRQLSPGTMREIQQEADQMVRLFKAFNAPDSDEMKCPTQMNHPKCESLLKDVEESLQRLKDELATFTEQLRKITNRPIR